MGLSKAKIQLFRSLHRKKGRREHQLFLVEGADLIKEALREGWPLREIVLTHYFGRETDAGRELVHLADLAEVPCDFCSQSDMNRITDTQTPQGAAAIAEMALPLSGEETAPEVLLICEQISDPGNLGTLIRTADWFGLQKILTGRGSVDPYNPKVVRSSAGSLFRLKVETADDLVEIIRAETQRGRTLFAAVLDGELTPKDLPGNGLRGLVLGQERRGVSPDVAQLCTASVRIERHGRAESLNLSIAAGILLYELSG
jgi:TrmH family RNA methyltransferase